MKQEMGKSEVQTEYQKAKSEGRQPTCPYCNAPLEIGQFYSVYVQWKWNDKEKAYEKGDLDWDPDKPFCEACEAHDWDFIDEGLINF